MRARAQEEFDFIVAADARAGVGVSTSYAEMLRNYENALLIQTVKIHFLLYSVEITSDLL